MAATCPSCPGAPVLSAMETAGATLGFCASCRGLWVGRDEWRAALGRPLEGASPAGRSRGLACPGCGDAGGRLETLTVAGPPALEIDRCPGCEGIWLDAGEMTALREALRRAGASGRGADVVETWSDRAAAAPPVGAVDADDAADPAVVPREIVATERPDPAFWNMTLMQSLIVVICSFGLALPIIVIALIPGYFRYHTTRYAFDDEGVGVSWGLIFQQATHVTYGKLQDIHLTRGLFERWFGLGTVKLQTASGSASAEATLYGLKNAEVVRDYLYQRMRGWKDDAVEETSGPDALTLLAEIRDEVARLRAAVEPKGGSRA